MSAGTGTPRRTPPLWLLVPAGMLVSIAAAVVAVVVSVNVDRECATAERLVNAFDDDPQVLFQAQARLRLVLVTHPHSARAWALASRIARVSGDPGPGGGGAEPVYSAKVIALVHQGARKALAGEPRSWEGHVAEGWAFACERDWLMAADESRKAAAIAPAEPRVLELAARVARAERRPEDAVRAYATIEGSASADSALRAGACEQLATLYGGMQSPREADSCFRRALELAPRTARVRRDYARWLTSCGRHDDAIAQADAACALGDGAPNRSARAAAHVGRGVWLIDVAHDPEDAMKEFEQAGTDRPDDAGIWFDLALAHLGLYRQGKAPAEREAALAAIQKAEQYSPGDPDVRELRAIITTSGASVTR